MTIVSSQDSAEVHNEHSKCNVQECVGQKTEEK